VAKVVVENLPTEVAPKVLGEITDAAVEANPQAARQIPGEVAKATAQTSASHESLDQKTPQAGPLKNGAPSSEGEPEGEVKSKSSSAAESAAAASATASASVSAGTVSMEAAPAPAASSDLDKRLTSLLDGIIKTVKEINIGETTTTITFNDATLRDVTVEISSNNGRLEVAFTTSDPDSQALLQSNIAALQNALQAGSGSSAVSVTVAGDSETDASAEFAGTVGEGGSSKSEASGSDKKVSAKGGASSS
jgi:hypothetical protein